MPSAMAVDSSNSVIVTGCSAGVGSSFDYLTIKYSSAGVPLWTNRYSGPGKGDDYARAVAVDGNNDVVVTGYTTNAASGDDYVTIKYSSTGVPLWTNQYNGPGNGGDIAWALAIFGNNDVIVTGISAGIGSSDCTTIKYSSAGVPLWTNRYDGPANGSDYGKAIAIDADGNAIVVGSSAGRGSGFDYLILKYSAVGVPLWTNRYNATANDADLAAAVVVDGSNHVIVTGNSTSPDGDYDYATIKYSGAGIPLWTNRYNGPTTNFEFAIAVAVDASNSVIVTGQSDGASLYAYPRTYYAYATVKYSSAGVPIWTNRFKSSDRVNDEALALAVDGRGNIFVTGGSDPSGYNSDYATINYSGEGLPLWTNRYNGPGNDVDRARAIVVDHSGNLLVAGESFGSGSAYDFATIKYLCRPNPVVTPIGFTNGAFLLRLDNLSPPGTLIVESATNLEAWSSLDTNTFTEVRTYFSDPQSTTWPTRLYRIRLR